MELISQHSGSGRSSVYDHRVLFVLVAKTRCEGVNQRVNVHVEAYKEYLWINKIIQETVSFTFTKEEDQEQYTGEEADEGEEQVLVLALPLHGSALFPADRRNRWPMISGAPHLLVLGQLQG